MTFPKQWQPAPDASTPASASALIDLERRVALNELYYAEKLDDQTVANAPTTLLGLDDITFTVDERGAQVTLTIPVVLQNTVNGLIIARIADETAAEKNRAVAGNINAGQFGAVSVIERISVPGTYTRQAQLWSSAGTTTAYCGTGLGKAIMWVRTN